MINNILNMLFIKENQIDRKAFRNLYYSYDNISFVGFDLSLININKKYESYEILKHRNKIIGENHMEDNLIVMLDKLTFIRILRDNDSLIYDVLIQTIDDKDKYERIFFKEEISIPTRLDKLNKAIFKIIDNHMVILKNVGMFSNYLGYEDWDYTNKKNNMIDTSSIDMDVASIEFKSFKGIYTFHKNSGIGDITLKLDFIYDDGFYILNEIEEL